MERLGKALWVLLLIGALAALALTVACGDDDDDDDDDDDAADDDDDNNDAADDDDDTAEGPIFLPISGRWWYHSLHLRPYYAMLENTHYVLVATRKLAPKRDADCYQASEGMRQVWAAATGNNAADYPESCSDGALLTFDLGSVPMVVPYPNDLYRVPDPSSTTGFRVQIDGDTALPMGRLSGMGLFGFVTNDVNALNGFSTAADLYLPMGTEPNPNSLPDADDPGIDDSIFVMSHAKPAADTKSIAARYAPILQQLQGMGVAPDQVLSISDFSTLWITKDLDDVRATLDTMAAESPPQLTDWDFQTHAWPELEGFAYATLRTPIFKNAKGYWIRDAAGNYQVQSWEDVQVLFSLPSAQAHPDGQPYPLVLYGHGVGDRKESLSVAPLVQKFSEAGLAFAGIDAVCHGKRAPIPDDPVTTMLCYFNFFDPLDFRDNLRETIANKMWFVRALKQLGDVDMIPEGGDGIADFDVNHIYYMSISMGSIHGGVLSAMEANIDAYAMSSAGAKYTGIALEGPYMGQFVDIAQLIDQFMPDLHAEELLWLVGGMAQHILDASDPINFLPHTNMDPLPSLNGHKPAILQQGAAEDYMLGGISGAYFCRAGGWPQLEPYVWDVQFVDHKPCPHEGSAFFQYNTDEHFWLWNYGEMGDAYRAQAAHFLRSHYDSGQAEIINAMAQ